MWGMMSAMPEEAQSLIGALRGYKSILVGGREYHQGHLWGHPVTLVFSRWGKVAAASTATSLIERFGCKKIVFTGVAGAATGDLCVGDVVIGTQLFQHDMDARPIFKRFEIPLTGKLCFETDAVISEHLFVAAQNFAERMSEKISAADLKRFHMRIKPEVIRGVIASGDKFFAEKDEIYRLKEVLPEVACVEMEGAAVAQVCYEHSVPLALVRTISDSADDSAHIDFQSFVSAIATTYTHEILERFFKSYAG